MPFNTFWSMLLSLVVFFLTASTSWAQSPKWQITTITSTSYESASSGSSIIFNLDRGSQAATCSKNWYTTAVPNVWDKCTDPILRFRISSYTSAGNFSLHIVQIDLINSTVPATINITQATTSFSPANLSCSTTNTGQNRCQLLSTLAPIALTTTPSTFQPKPLNIHSTILRSGGSLAVQNSCSSSSTFLILDPSVATLGSLTAETWTNEKVWRTSCATNLGLR
ncbi:hypothetical protein B0J14DRAFT_654003 [Halenospora varia]|nr:hypothetical protein B0J14DRAFT_654003 [Halenospora varia]